MPPALDRLLASPSALRLLRSIVLTPELPTACSASTNCCKSAAAHRQIYTSRRPAAKQEWKRWHDASRNVVRQERDTLQPEDSITRGAREVISSGVDHNITRTWNGEDDDALWAATLAQQERLKRLQGIKTIWKAIRFRRYQLPIDETPHAEFLWGTLIKNPKIVKEVIDHAADIFQQDGKTYPRLYDLVLRYWLPRQPTDALDYHHHILVKLNLKKLPLQGLARNGRSIYRRATYEALMDIYRNSNERDLYDEVVPVLIEKDYIDVARRWHSLCLFRNDTPSEAVAAHPVVQVFLAEASSISEPKIHFESMGTQTGRDHRRYNQDLMRRLLGRDTAPVRFEDSFCARMFATRTFPPASIIQGLALVGVNEIGPQAVLAMASRTLPVEELPNRFEELRAAGIALRGCVFSLAMEKFAMEQKWNLVRSMLDSDQHPDVFGDADVQRKLLDYYLENEDYVQAQRTLAVLTLFHNESSMESWNLLLQTQLKRAEPRQVFETLQDMRSRKVMLTLESILEIKSLLRQRRPGRKPGRSSRGRFDDLRFVTRIYMSILESGMGAVAPSAWREIIRRFGMLGRLRELKRLLLWLLCWYAPRGHSQFAELPRSPFLDSATKKLRALHPERNHYFHFPVIVAQQDNDFHPIRQIFKPSLQQALIVWGFRAGILPHAHLEQSMLGSTLAKQHYRRRLLKNQVLRRLNWSIGLRIVAQLRDLGVYVHRHTVSKAVQSQFVIMFGRGQSSNKENRLLEKANTESYVKYVKEVNRIWGSPLIPEPGIIMTSKLHKHMWHPGLRRTIKRPASISLKEVLGAGWQNHNGVDPGEGSKDEVDDSKKDLEALEELKKHFVAQEKAMGSPFLLPYELGSRKPTRVRDYSWAPQRIAAVVVT